MGALLWAALTGCAPSVPVPLLDRVEPAWGYNGEATEVHVHGVDLLPGVAVGPDGGRFDDTFVVTLEHEEHPPLSLQSVSLLSYHELAGVVPAGGEPGLYGLRVVTPTGVEAFKPSAFAVSSIRADRLALEVRGSAEPEAGDVVELGVELQDPAGAWIAADLAVRVRLASSAEVPTAALVGWDLAGGLVVDGELRGVLEDGLGVVKVSAEAAEAVSVTVQAEDDQSGVSPASTVLSFSAGDYAGLRLDLPYEGFVGVAGDPFVVTLTAVDEAGVPVSAAFVDDIELTEVCGSFRDRLEFTGAIQVEVTLTTATDPVRCPLNALVAYEQGEQGRSEPFPVLPGSPALLRVVPLASLAVAGEPLGFQVSALDAHGNEVPDHEASLVVRDSAGSASWYDCGEPFDGLRTCEVLFTRAVEDTRVTVLDADGVEGTAEGIPVVAGAVASWTVSGPVDPVLAGEPFAVSPRFFDGWGNEAAVDLAADPVQVTAGEEAVPCAVVGPELACTLTGVAAAVELAVAAPSLGLSTVLAAFPVVNGHLATVEVEADASTLTAGESLGLTLRAYDGWGNPYTTLHVATVAVEDDGGVLEPALPLTTSGVTTASVTLTRAGDPVTVRVTEGGAVRGEVSVTVVAGPVDHLSVDAAPYVWIGQPQRVTVTAGDAWDNPVLDYEGPVDVASDKGLFLSLSLEGFVDGVLNTEIVWDTAGLRDRVGATGPGGETGDSPFVDALDDACADGPSAEVLLDGSAEDVVCLVTASVVVAVDLSGSASGSSRSLSAWHFEDGAGGHQRLTSPSTTMTASATGAWKTTAVVTDSAGCAARAEASLWVAPDDGSPAGPITVTSARSAVTTQVGGAPSTTQVSVEARDCSGDVASGAEVYLRSNRGVFKGLTATGEGLSLRLDASGQGQADLTVEATLHDGTALVEVGALHGGAWGSVAVDVLGDNAPPTVVDVQPEGTTAALVESVTVSFSEPLVDPGGSAVIELVGPAGLESVAWALSADAATLSISPEAALDASAGAWVVSLQDLQDQSGNYLDGTWSGGSDAFTTTFGDVALDGLEMDACVPSSPAFVPDGDSGVGEEADEVAVTVSADDWPAWWAVEVGGPGGRVAAWRVAATGSVEVIAWDGRGLDGGVVGPGSYEVAVAPVDAGGNHGAPCTVAVDVVQRYGEPR